MQCIALRPAAAVATFLLTALTLSSAAGAQNCYENPTGHQCFSFAPQPGDANRLDTGLNLRSERLKVTGDIRLRLRTAESHDNLPYNVSDQQATRARVLMEYDLNDKASAVVEYNFSETWAGAAGYSDAQPGMNFNGISQAYLDVDDMFGFGDKWRVGRSTFVLGNGLILGSCDFLQYPSTFTGIWASRNILGHDLEVFGVDNYGPLHSPNAGTRFWGATVKINFCEESPVRFLHLIYMAGTKDGGVSSTDSWIGAESGGVIPGKIDWSAQVAQRQVTGGKDILAYRVKVERKFEGVFHGVSLTRTDSEGPIHVNPADFNSAGLLHQYGGAWRSDLDTNQLGVSLRPGGDINLDFNFLTLDRDGKAKQLGDFEYDVMVGRQFESGVFVWAGYGRDNDNREVGYLQLTLQF